MIVKFLASAALSMFFEVRTNDKGLPLNLLVKWRGLRLLAPVLHLRLDAIEKLDISYRDGLRLKAETNKDISVDATIETFHVKRESEKVIISVDLLETPNFEHKNAVFNVLFSVVDKFVPTIDLLIDKGIKDEDIKIEGNTISYSKNISGLKLLDKMREDYFMRGEFTEDGLVLKYLGGQQVGEFYEGLKEKLTKIYKTQKDKLAS